MGIFNIDLDPWHFPADKIKPLKTRAGAVPDGGRVRLSPNHRQIAICRDRTDLNHFLLTYQNVIVGFKT